MSNAGSVPIPVLVRKAPPAIVIRVDSLNVRQGSTATFGAKRSSQPDANVTVTVRRASGDRDITVTGGSSLTFTTSNWDTYQTVTLSAAEDVEPTNGSATIRCGDGILSIIGAVPCFVQCGYFQNCPQ